MTAQNSINIPIPSTPTISERTEYKSPTDSTVFIDSTIQTNYTVRMEKHGKNSFVASCDELEGAFANGEDYEDLMLRMRTVIETVLRFQGKPTKNFNLRPIIDSR